MVQFRLSRSTNSNIRLQCAQWERRNIRHYIKYTHLKQPTTGTSSKIACCSNVQCIKLDRNHTFKFYYAGDRVIFNFADNLFSLVIADQKKNRLAHIKRTFSRWCTLHSIQKVIDDRWPGAEFQMWTKTKQQQSKQITQQQQCPRISWHAI